MSFLIPPEELASLFVTGNFPSGRDVTPRYKLLRFGPLRGTLSLFHIKVKQQLPSNFWSGVILVVVFIGLSALCSLLSNDMTFKWLSFFAGFVFLGWSTIKILIDAHTMYNHAEDWCLMAANHVLADRKHPAIEGKPPASAAPTATKSPAGTELTTAELLANIKLPVDKQQLSQLIKASSGESWADFLKELRG
jgi:hypothetical protein